MKFSEFDKSNAQKPKSTKSDSTTLNQSDTKQIEDLYQKYSQMNYDELMAEFLKVSQQEKMNGNLSADSIQNIKDTLSPYLSSEAKAKMEDLTKNL